MSAKWSKCVQTTITGKTSEQLQEMKAKSSNDQNRQNGTKIRVFSTTTTSLLMIDWCGPQLQRRLNFSCWFTFRQTLATILASLKCKVIQFQERKLEISTAAVFKVTEIAFSSSSLAAAEAGLKRLRLKSLKKVSLRFNFTFYCKMFEFLYQKLLWNL